MEFPIVHHPDSYYQYLSPSSHTLFPYNFVQENHVHWSETPESHIFSADIPGFRKEEIKVEVEDSNYMIIRTEAIDVSEQARAFKRKFRLPGRIDIGGITAKYEDGVLSVTVPRAFRRSNFYIDPSDVPQQLDTLARAA